MKRYLLDKHNIYTGVSIDITPFDTFPVFSTEITPPELSEGEYAQFNGDSWTIINTLPVDVPEQVTRMQALVAMKNAGILGNVRAIFNGQPNDNTDRLKFENALHFNRNDELIASMATQLNLTETELDDLFRDAATIN